MLLLLLLGFYTVLGSMPTFDIPINYITWFGIIYLIASYIRLYPRPLYKRKTVWIWMTLLNIVLAVLSIIALRYVFGSRLGLGYYFVSDTNKIFAVTIAVCSFLWFKNMNIRYSKLINSLGAGTFGVLLIHANLGASRWLWKDTFDVVGHYSLPLWYLIPYSIGVVLVVFTVGNLIDQLRITTIEKWFLGWYDRKWSAKADTIIERMKK